MHLELSEDERIMMDYLLGNLKETEAERLDQLSITDQDFGKRLLAIENDLVDAYIRGELSEKDRTKFQAHYLATPIRREKVQFAKALIQQIDLRSDEDAVLVQLPGFSRFVSQWGLSAAAVLVFLISGFLLFQNIRLRGQIAAFQKEQSALKQQEKDLRQQLSNDRFSSSEKEKELERIRARLTQLEQQLAMKGLQTVKMFAFKLEPPTRGISKLPQFILPMDANIVTWTLTVESNDFVAYEALLKDPVAGKELWRSDHLRGAVRFTIPASLFGTQKYSIELYGISTSGMKEIITNYPFRIVRR